MGCDIHSYAEQQDARGEWHQIPDVSPFDWRSYSVYGFLADVRNYSMVTPLAEPRGIPVDTSREVRSEYEDWGVDGHSASWLSLDELAGFDYDQTLEDRRVTRQVGPNAFDGAALAEPGGGEMTTYREFLGAAYFRDLETLQAIDAPAVRIVFWFDN